MVRRGTIYGEEPLDDEQEENEDDDVDVDATQDDGGE